MTRRRNHRFAGAVLLLQLVILVLGQPTSSVVAQEEGNPLVLSFEELGFGDVPIFGKFDRDELWIPFQSNWVFNDDLVVELEYVASTELHADAAIAAVIDDTHVASFHPITDGLQHRYIFSIPPALFDEDASGLFLIIEGHLPLSRDFCEAPFLDGQWVTLQKSSRVVLNPQYLSAPPTLADLPQVIVVEGNYTEPPPVVFVLPDDYDAEDLTVAANIAGGLGREAARNNLPFQFRTPSSLTLAEKRSSNFIFIDVTDSDLQRELGISDESESPELAIDEARIEITQSPWNTINNVLIVNAGGPAGLKLVGDIFVNPMTMNGLLGQSMIVGPKILDLPGETTLPWQQETTTFAQLGSSDLQLQGAGTQFGSYVFRRPPGWLLERNSQITLHMSANPARNPDLDLPLPTMKVFANDVEIGTVDFGEIDDLEDIWITFDLPTLVLNETPTAEERPQVIDLLLEVEHSNYGDCAQLNTDRFWTLVYDDSYFTISYHQDRQLPNLQLLPYPFVNNEDVGVALILDNNPSANEIGMGLSLSATLGQYAYDDLQIRMLTADEANNEELAEWHLILLGQTDKHPLIQEFLSLERRWLGLIEAGEVDGIGFLHETLSPWNIRRVVLAVYSETPEGLENAAQALYMKAPPVVQPSSVVSVEGDAPPEVVFRSDTLDSVREREFQRIELTEDLLIGSVLLVLVVLVGAIFFVGSRNVKK